MDLPGSGQMDAVVGRALAAGDDARLRALEQKPARHTRDDLARTAREFESVFMGILMRSMRQTVPDSGLMGSGGATDIYRQMHDSEMARSISGSGGGLGIARLLESHFADAFPEDAGAADAEGEGALAAPAAGRGLPASLALSRYRQGGAAAAPSVLATTNLLQPVFGPPAPPESPALPARVPVADVREPDEDARRRSPRVAPPVEAEPEASPARLGLLPTDLRLSGAPLVAAEADTVRRFGPAIDKAASGAGLDPRLVLAVVMEESGGNPSARSPAGARGLMQLMPGTARDLGVADALDPAANLDGGARYLATQLERYEGRLDLALAAYNAGPGNVDRAGRRVPAFTETRNYVDRVMGRYARLRSGTDLDTGQR